MIATMSITTPMLTLLRRMYLPGREQLPMEDEQTTSDRGQAGSVIVRPQMGGFGHSKMGGFGHSKK
jgi:hypothetical protein